MQLHTSCPDSQLRRKVLKLDVHPGASEHFVICDSPDSQTYNKGTNNVELF